MATSQLEHPEAPAPASGRDRARRMLRAAIRAAHTEMQSQPEFPSRAGFARTVGPGDLRELGTSGVLRDGNGLPCYDHNPEMAPVEARGLYDDHGVYHRMALTDPILGGVIGLVTREVLRAHYQVLLPPDATEEERRAGRLVSRFFGLDGTQGYLEGGLTRTLLHACQAHVYGFSLMEMTWAAHEFEGETVLAPSRLRWRAPWSIERWLWQDERLIGCQQLTQNDANVSAEEGGPYGLRVLNTGKMGAKRVTIPADRMLLFNHGAVDGNPEGVSLLRPAFRFWQLKQNTLRRIERSEEMLWGGTTIVEEITNSDGSVVAPVSEADYDYVCDLLEQRLDNVIKYMIQPAGLKLRTDFPSYELEDRTNYLVWIDHQLLSAVNAGLFGLSASHAGSKALSGTLGQVFYSAIEGLARAICDTINGLPGTPYTGLVNKLVEANIAINDGFRMPKLEPRGIAHQDIGAVSDLVLKMDQAGAIVFGVEDEKYLRKLSQFPELSDEAIEVNREARRAARAATLPAAPDEPDDMPEDDGEDEQSEEIEE